MLAHARRDVRKSILAVHLYATMLSGL